MTKPLLDDLWVIWPELGIGRSYSSGAVIQLALLAVALRDLLNRERRVKGGNKLVWALIIVFVNLIGPLVYFLLGARGGLSVEPANRCEGLTKHFRDVRVGLDDPPLRSNPPA